MNQPRLSPLAERRKRILKIILAVMSALMVVLVLSVLVLIIRSESAHDEASCPFAKHSERPAFGVLVIEESRSCVPEAEEHRWLVSRGGKPGYELARKRLPKALFAPDRTKWSISEDDEKLLVLRIEVDGKLSSEFREVDVAEDVRR